MPQASEAVRQYWGQGSGGQDAQQRAEQALLSAGCTINKGMILIPDSVTISAHLDKALEYLCDEWDYDYEYLAPQEKET